MKAGFVAVVGRPNVGKSTLLNCLVQQKIAITSKRPQTTRHRIRGILTEEPGQIVFLDTPGMMQAKNRLGEYMVRVVKKSMPDADLILWVVEAGDHPGAKEEMLLSLLKEQKRPVILVVNKMDTLKNPNEILLTIDRFRKVFDFAEIVPISAKTGANRSELVDAMFSLLPEGEPFYDEDEVTDQTIRQLVAEIIREKALHALSEEIPHGIAVMVETFQQKSDKTLIEAVILCEKDSHKGIIIGKQGAMIKKIGTNARFEIEKLLEQKCALTLFVKVQKDWRESDVMLKNLGFGDE